MFRSYRDTIRTPVAASKEAARKYYCDLCDDGDTDQAWYLELDVEIHRRRVHKVELIQLMREPKNYMCSICLRTQADRPTLIAHIKKFHLLSPPHAICVKREIFVCDYCSNIFFNKHLLIAHIKYFHLLTNAEKKMAKTICPACLKTVKVKSMWFHFLYHGIIHTGTCPVCLCTFENYNIALEHIESHPGYYNCNLCSYHAKKEYLFQNHVEKHKKLVNLDGKDDVNAVARFFVPQRRPASWSRKYVNIFRGIRLAPEVQICVLCRTICDTEEQMLQHIYGDHSPDNVVEIKRYTCSCGDEFFNSVLLKHHIFTLKGDHRVYNETDTSNSTTSESTQDNATEAILQGDNSLYGIEIVIQEAISDTEANANPETPEDSQAPNQMNCEPTKNSEELVNRIPSINSMNSATDNQTQEMLNQINSRTENQIHNKDRSLQSERMDESDITTDDTDEKSVIVDNTNVKSSNDVNVPKNQVNSTNIHQKIVFETNNGENKTVYQVCDPMGSESATVSAMFGSPKQYYEQVLSLDQDMATLCSATGSSTPMEFINGAEEEAVIYQVLEVPADTDENAERILVGESILYR